MRTGFAAVWASVWAAALALGTGAAAQDRVPAWSAWVEEGLGWAADCSECFENEYVLLGCTRGESDVRAELIGLITPDGAGERIDVVLDVDGVSEQREAAVEFSEMFGPVPVLTLQVGDPLFARIRSGGVLTLSTPGDRLEIPLTGARAALDTMFAACR